MNSSPLTNSYLELPNLFYQKSSAAHFDHPQLLLFNESLAVKLGFNYSEYTQDELAQIFSGQKLLENCSPIALAYAGFQFGHPVPSLGDGRALLLGELNGHDIQLKGSGQTPFSRRGDGRSALGPVLREYIVSEFMHRMNIPTTRSLAAVTTGEMVLRQFGPEPGGIFTRVASSHLRVGTFQYAIFNKDYAALESLLNYAVKRHYPELINCSLKDKALHFLESFASKQGELIAKWSAIGFIHGVMNTDNCAVDGVTIDYGPCAFMDEFKFHQVFSSIDEGARYSYFNQVPIIQWNILRLADCLLPLISHEQKLAVKEVEQRLHPILNNFHRLRMKRLGEKLGIQDYQDEDEALIIEFLKYLEEESLDFTLAFRNLKDTQYFRPTERFKNFHKKWTQRVRDIDHLDLVNPLYIPRNHLIQKAIDLAYQGDLSFAKQLLKVLSDPFTEREEYSALARMPVEDEKVTRTFCGT